MSDVCIILAGIPLSDFPEKPDDLPNSFKIDCPICKNPMWFTDRKRRMEQEAISTSKPYHVSCWLCIQKDIDKNPIKYKSFVGVSINHE